MQYTDCIWDFNGTILDDVDVGIRAVNLLLERRGLPTLKSREEYRNHFGFPVENYYKSIGFDFTKESYDTVAVEWVREYLRLVPEAPLFSDVRETLECFRSLGIRQTLLSATEEGMLTRQLQDLGIASFFDEILGIDNIKAGSKLARAVEWRTRHPGAKAFYLGDTEHDADSARIMEADCFLILGGHQDETTLRKTGARVLSDRKAVYQWMIENSCCD